MMHIFLANSLWWLTCLPGRVAFECATRDVARTQERVLLHLLQHNATTEYGRRYGFAQLRSAHDYRRRVPLTGYDDYRQAIERIGAGSAHVLSADPVLLLEPTGGSSGGTRLIPYTARLKAEFQRALAPWVADLFTHYPGLLHGTAYWSVSPVARHDERSPAGIPIGFEDDGAYLGWFQQRLVGTLLAVPPLVRRIESVDTFRYVTLLFLLRSPTLSLISVWNPTFLMLLVEPLADWGPRLAADIAAGTLSPPGELDARLHRSLVHQTRPDPQRAARVRAALGGSNEPGTLHTRLWPQLELISCWADGPAAREIPALQRLFPQAHIQGKGLLATEGCVSFPLVGREGAALALRSHFFEFLPVGSDDGQATRLAHELEIGSCYELVLTTGGGLYRYRLHDYVEVTGSYATCPLLRFLGKSDLISDWFGEKLHAAHVQQALDSVCQDLGIQPPFAMLACEKHDSRPAYILFIEVQGEDATLRALGVALETRLLANFHYRYCRDLGQLAPLHVFRIEDGAGAAYVEHCRQRGQRLGDIKPAVLSRHDGWLGAFCGRLI